MFFDVNAQDHIHLYLQRSLSEINWNELWATTCHLIWYWRNNIMRTDDFIMSIDIVQNIKDKV